MTIRELYRDDLLNRFPAHTFLETPIQSMTLVEFRDAGLTVIGSAQALAVDDAYERIRFDLVGDTKILPYITTAERNALTNTLDGTNILNIDTASIERCIGGVWVPTNQILDGNFNFQGSTKFGGDTSIDPNGAIDVVGDDAASTRIRTTRYQNNANGGAGIQLGHSRGSETAPSALLLGDKLGQVLFIGDDGVSQNSSGSFVRSYTTENWSSTNKGCEIRFETIPNGATAVAVSFTISNSGYAEAPSYTVAGLPPVGSGGGFIYVSDETGGATLAFSDGTDWRRVQDRAIVS